EPLVPAAGARRVDHVGGADRLGVPGDPARPLYGCVYPLDLGQVARRVEGVELDDQVGVVGAVGDVTQRCPAREAQGGLLGGHAVPVAAVDAGLGGVQRG